jgi:hypothetical protein
VGKQHLCARLDCDKSECNVLIICCNVYVRSFDTAEALLAHVNARHRQFDCPACNQVWCYRRSVTVIVRYTQAFDDADKLVLHLAGANHGRELMGARLYDLNCVWSDCWSPANGLKASAAQATVDDTDDDVTGWLSQRFAPTHNRRAIGVELKFI